MKHSAKLVLASKSPRRKELLKAAGFDFVVKTIDFDESFPEEMEVDKVAEFLAVEKNKAHRHAFENEVILTADTVVIFSNKILGKPRDQEEARQTLKLLSGKVHRVMSGVCISSPEKIVSFASTTDVKFRDLEAKEIDHYIASGAASDKAGSYGIQDWIGLIGVEWIKGSYYNVVGLPVDEVYRELRASFPIA